ncbi:MAG: type IV pilus modification protein PilV [Proteobacteria bacterium]|nr:MAG: type IV pilus modification protein PilV [Pseudomonadota bacterium]
MVPKLLRHAQLGFSLMEILISIVVLSFGLLGLGGLQMTALKETNNSHFRTVASLAVTDLADRMRANYTAAEAGQYNSQYDLSTCNTPPEKLCKANTICTPSELAVYDLYHVNCGVVAGNLQTGGIQYNLPSAYMSVACGETPCKPDSEHTILVRWEETDNDDSDTQAQTRTYVLKFSP